MRKPVWRWISYQYDDELEGRPKFKVQQQQREAKEKTRQIDASSSDLQLQQEQALPGAVAEGARLSSTFQRKIDVASVPLAAMQAYFADEAALLSSRDRLALRQNRQRQPFICVASLVDKAPNLGGLCRTLEIFNCEQLVIGDESMKEDGLFQRISVTACVPRCLAWGFMFRVIVEAGGCTGTSGAR